METFAIGDVSCAVCDTIEPFLNRVQAVELPARGFLLLFAVRLSLLPRLRNRWISRPFYLKEIVMTGEKPQVRLREIVDNGY